MIGIAFTIFGVLVWLATNCFAIGMGGALIEEASYDESILKALGGLALILAGVFSFCLMLGAMIAS